MSATQQTSLAPSALELALLQQLKAVGGTCTALTALPIEKKSSLRQRERACQTLRDRGWLDYDHDIAQFGLTIVGKTLLKLSLSVWPVTPDELLVLRSCLGGRIHPDQIHRRVPVYDRQRLLERLAKQGLIVVYKRAIANLHITDSGDRCLSETH